MDRTLYLSEKKGLEVITDGPSLWIREEGRADRRIPARLIGRVVIIGNVRLDAGLITLFAENDVPVTFMTMKGERAAVAMPYNHHLPLHYEEQKIFLETEENIRRFTDWAISERRRFQLRNIARLSSAASDEAVSQGLRERDYQTFISLYNRGGQGAAVQEMVVNLLREVIIISLMKADLDPHMGVIHRRHNLGLALDLCHIMGPEADLQAVQFVRRCGEDGFVERGGKAKALSDRAVRDVVHRFENRREKNHAAVERIIDNLFELMRELRS